MKRKRKNHWVSVNIYGRKKPIGKLLGSVLSEFQNQLQVDWLDMEKKDKTKNSNSPEKATAEERKDFGGENCRSRKGKRYSTLFGLHLLV